MQHLLYLFLTHPHTNTDPVILRQTETTGHLFKAGMSVEMQEPSHSHTQSSTDTHTHTTLHNQVTVQPHSAANVLLAVLPHDPGMCLPFDNSTEEFTSMSKHCTLELRSRPTHAL